jgi:hypothetical protein
MDSCLASYAHGTQEGVVLAFGPTHDTSRLAAVVTEPRLNEFHKDVAYLKKNGQYWHYQVHKMQVRNNASWIHMGK